MDWKSLAETKAGILCCGLKESKAAEEIYALQHPTLHKRTGNAGLQLALPQGFIVNGIYGEAFCKKSPYLAEKQGKQFFVSRNGSLVCACTPIPAPKWYHKTTTDGKPMSSIMLQEGKDTLISSVWNNCCYFQNGTQCKFCILGYQKEMQWKNEKQVLETLLAALEENPAYQLHLTAGNSASPDHGLANYEKYVKTIRKETNLPVTLEISPPEDLKQLESIIAAGANGFSINIEIWDEKKRREICPGKSKIKREKYFQAWQKAVDLLGKFKTSSVLIVGLDSKENIAEGIRAMACIGIKPVLIPFRPFAKSALHYLQPPKARELMKLSEIAGKELKKAGAKEKELIGCEHCGACSLEKDFLVNARKENAEK